MNKFEILNYAILGIVTGVFGYVLYLYIVVPHICSTTTIQNILSQCKVFDTNTRVQYTIPFVMLEIILIAIKIRYQPDRPITSSQAGKREDSKWHLI